MMAFGCSVMYGEEIETQQTIPKLLAEHFGEELINHAKVGSSNDEIIHTAFTEITPKQTVIIGITDVARVYWPHSMTDNIQSYSVSNFRGKLIGLKNTLDSWYKFCYNEEVLYKYTYQKLKHLEKYCHNMGNNIYFFNFCSGRYGFSQAEGRNWCTKDTSLVSYTDQFELGRMPNGHPSSRAHLKYTRYLLENYPALKEKTRH